LDTTTITSADSNLNHISNEENNEIGSWEQNLQQTLKSKPPSFINDEVIRVMDPNTVKLKKKGLVSYALVKTPSGYKDPNFRFPDCMEKSPISKSKQLLPPGTKVMVRTLGEPNSSSSSASSSQSIKVPALIVITSNQKLVNAELVRNGYAKPMLSSSSFIKNNRDMIEKLIPGLSNGLDQLQKQAEMKGLGIYRNCELTYYPADDQFEPLDYTTEIQYGDDSGKLIVRNSKEERSLKAPPPNPGDVKRCADFEYYEEALRWYDFYFKFYGDVAKLDRDGDGVPCPGLPHTTDQTKYRMKIPSSTTSR